MDAQESVNEIVRWNVSEVSNQRIIAPEVQRAYIAPSNDNGFQNLPNRHIQSQPVIRNAPQRNSSYSRRNVRAPSLNIRRRNRNQNRNQYQRNDETESKQNVCKNFQQYFSSVCDALG